MESSPDSGVSVSTPDMDPCTGFPQTYKAKLSITSIVWNKKQSRSGSVGESENPLTRSSLANRRRDHWIGILFTVLSTFVFSLNALVGKLLSHLHPFNVGVWTFLLMTIVATILILYQRIIAKNTSLFSALCISNDTNENDTGKVVFFLCVRSFCGVSALIFFFYAVKYLTVADVLVIDASSPIFVYLLAFIFLGEKFGIIPVFATILAFSGVALIARPPLFTHQTDYDLNNLIGVLFAVSVMLCIATSIISLKFLENVHHAVINFSFGLWGAVQCVLVSWICDALAIPGEIVDIFKIVGVAVLFYLGQAFLTVALKYADAGPVGLLRTTEVMFIFIWQLVFLGVVPDAYSWCGAFLILFGVFLTLFRNWISDLPEDSRMRGSCNWLLC